MNNRVPEVSIRRFPDGGDMVRMTKTGNYGDQTMITLTEAETVELIAALSATLGQLRAERAERGGGSNGTTYDDEEAAAANRF